MVRSVVGSLHENEARQDVAHDLGGLVAGEEEAVELAQRLVHAHLKR